jgi:hypothetical protein
MRGNMTRVQLHKRSVEMVRSMLAAHGIRVQAGPPRAASGSRAVRFDLVAEDLTIAVRVAKRSTFPWQVLVHGKRYSYRYHGHRWNLHSHGSTKLRPDVWVFVASSTCSRFFVVPGRRVRGFYTLTLRESSRTWLLAYENRWETIHELATVRQRNVA